MKSKILIFFRGIAVYSKKTPRLNKMGS